MSYAIVSIGGKQYTVREGQRLLVDRLAYAEGNTFTPPVLLAGGDGGPRLSPADVTVTARVVGLELGEKIRIGKYKAKKGYRRHTGFRAKLSRIEIESIGAPSKRSAAKPTAEPAAVDEPERPKGMPAGYEDLTVAEIKEAASGWNAPMLEAALEYERANAARKGALAAIEAAIAAKEEQA
jgi:large subunit ribosomal protein L21